MSEFSLLEPQSFRQPPFPSSAIPPLNYMETLAPVLDVVKTRPYVSSVSVVLGCVALVRLARWRSRSHLPPGPKGLPIVGNLFDFDTTHVWEQFGAWGRQYGRFSFLHLPLSSHNPHFCLHVCSLNLLHI